MEVYVSINGPLRNLIEKFDYHYNNEFLESEIVVDEGTNPFEYKVSENVQNDNLLNYYTFQSIDEYNNFLFVDFPLEIFGHAGISYMGAMTDLNSLIYENPDVNFTLIGLDELGKSKSSTLFFLSKHSYLGNNIKFIKSNDIKKEWKKCDIWITDNKHIINMCPKNKIAVKFLTKYNVFFTHKNEINNLKECSKFMEKITTSTWRNLLAAVLSKVKTKKGKLK